ncbi:hypothetical protein EDD18DRAFT_611892 [Armillaria luteobubalina]|uniref:Uncharacterized protein n=1 Tax=Armillaria luteobubalina TaxID=153913 RepID=A0AA39QID2_9AGAR|nr:hypothetical protein EDD18DRAFT_611892 [Armillaria luteobubalina]
MDDGPFNTDSAIAHQLELASFYKGPTCSRSIPASLSSMPLQPKVIFREQLHRHCSTPVAKLLEPIFLEQDFIHILSGITLDIIKCIKCWWATYVETKPAGEDPEDINSDAKLPPNYLPRVLSSIKTFECLLDDIYIVDLFFKKTQVSELPCRCDGHHQLVLFVDGNGFYIHTYRKSLTSLSRPLGHDLYSGGSVVPQSTMTNYPRCWMCWGNRHGFIGPFHRSSSNWVTGVGSP